jgi:hypothetical protein
VCYPRPHLSVRFEAKHVPRLETLISNIACWAIKLVAAGRHCQSPLFGSQQQTSSATISTLLVACPSAVSTTGAPATQLHPRQASTLLVQGKGEIPFRFWGAVHISPFPCNPIPPKAQIFTDRSRSVGC